MAGVEAGGAGGYLGDGPPVEGEVVLVLVVEAAADVDVRAWCGQPDLDDDLVLQVTDVAVTE